MSHWLYSTLLAGTSIVASTGFIPPAAAAAAAAKPSVSLPFFESYMYTHVYVCSRVLPAPERAPICRRYKRQSSSSSSRQSELWYKYNVVPYIPTL